MSIEDKMLTSFIQRHGLEALQIIESVDEDRIAELLESVAIEVAASLIAQMDQSIAVATAGKMPMPIMVEVLELLPFEKSEFLLRHIDKDLSSNILEQISPELQKKLKSSLSYSKDVAGAHLDYMTFTLAQDLSVQEGLARIKRFNPQIQSIVFVLDRQQHLVGYITLKELIIASEDKTIQVIMITDPPKVPAHMNVSSVFEGIYASYSQLPVVNESGKFLGVITKDRLSNLKAEKSSVKNEVKQAGSALGELYLLGLSGLLRSSTGMTDLPDQK